MPNCWRVFRKAIAISPICRVRSATRSSWTCPASKATPWRSFMPAARSGSKVRNWIGSLTLYRHPEEPCPCAASRRIATGALVAHPSRLAQAGEHLRMTAAIRRKAMPDFIALDALVGQTAAIAPDRIAVIDGERRLSYDGLDE